MTIGETKIAARRAQAISHRPPVMSALKVNPVIGFDRRPVRQRGDRRSSNRERRKSALDRRLTARRRSGIADRRRLQTDYPRCRRKQIAERRRMNGDRRFLGGTRHGARSSRPEISKDRNIRKGQLIDIDV